MTTLSRVTRRVAGRKSEPAPRATTALPGPIVPGFPVPQGRRRVAGLPVHRTRAPKFPSDEPEPTAAAETQPAPHDDQPERAERATFPVPRTSWPPHPTAVLIAAEQPPVPPAAPDPPQVPPGQRRRRLRIGALGAVACLCAAVVGTATLVERTPAKHAISHVDLGKTAVSWAARQLPHHARILTDSTAAAALRASGFTNARAAAPSGPGRRGAKLAVDYVLSTPALRTIAKPSTEAARAVTASLPIAVFGSDAGQVAIRQIAVHGASTAAAHAVTDLHTRRRVEPQLLTNPAIRFSASARSALKAGQLDLRALSVLALMADASPLELVRINIDSPERAAGRPARSMDVRAAKPAAVRAVLRGLAPSYRPIRDSRLGGGAQRIVWSIDIDPVSGPN
jgi:hypothetical protein